MSRVCDLCGKGTISGNSVSKSMNHQRRVWKPNLMKMKVKTASGAQTIRICARCLRTNDKYGFMEKKV